MALSGMVDGERLSAIDEDPEVAHATVLAMKAGLLAKAAKAKSPSLTLLEAIDLYVAEKEGVLSPSTIRGYETIKRNRFQSLMKAKINTLSKSDIQAAVTRESKMVSAKTVYNAYGLIRPVLKAFDVDVFGVKLLQIVKPTKRYLQPEEIGQLISAAVGDKYEAGVPLAVWLGMRRSEIIGLHWDCVDFAAKTITVRRTVVPNKENKWVVKDGAKNTSSQRTISCPEQIMDVLKQGYSEGAVGPVFQYSPKMLHRAIHRICAKAGITDTTVHGLRHTNAALMKSLGIDDAHAMARGGWTNESTYKKTYSYVFDQRATADDKKINDYIQSLHTNLHTD